MKHIEQAPDIPGARKLQPDEPAQAGDRYVYLNTLAFFKLSAPDLTLAHTAEVDDDQGGAVCIGRSLEEARAEWVRAFGDPDSFSAVLYRPTK